MSGDVQPAARRRADVDGVAVTVAGGRVPIACTRCRAFVRELDGRLACSACDATYAIVDGVPDMSDLADDDAGTAYKRRQMEFFDGEAAEFEITRPRHQPTLYGWLMAEKFRRSIRGVEARLAGATVLTVCGGSGMDAEFLARAGAIVVACDLSPGAVQRALQRGRRSGLPIDAVVADAEQLPFADRSFDAVYVHDGLHHLSDPLVGLAEMCRVARGCVLVTEPARAAVTQIAVRLGIALEREDAGNRVERVSRDQITACLTEHGLAVSGVDRYAMYYRHEPGWAMRFFSRRRAFRAARMAIVAFNVVLGSVGNKLSVRATRPRRGAET